MSTTTAGLVPAQAQSRTSQTTRETISPAVLRGELSRPVSSGEEAQALGGLQLAQYQQRPGGMNQQGPQGPGIGGGIGKIIGGIILGQQYPVQQIAPYNMLVSDGRHRFWVRAGEPIPFGVVQVQPTWWERFTGPWF